VTVFEDDADTISAGGVDRVRRREAK